MNAPDNSSPKEGDVFPIDATGGVLGLQCCEVEMVEGRRSLVVFLPVVPRFNAQIGGLYAFEDRQKAEAAVADFWCNLTDAEQLVFREGGWGDVVKLGARITGRLHTLWAAAEMKLVAPPEKK